MPRSSGPPCKRLQASGRITGSAAFLVPGAESPHPPSSCRNQRQEAAPANRLERLCKPEVTGSIPVRSIRERRWKGVSLLSGLTQHGADGTGFWHVGAETVRVLPAMGPLQGSVGSGSPA
jgi:hypothetical protein